MHLLRRGRVAAPLMYLASAAEHVLRIWDVRPKLTWRHRPSHQLLGVCHRERAPHPASRIHGVHAQARKAVAYRHCGRSWGFRDVSVGRMGRRARIRDLRRDRPVMVLPA
jgi:hypothetical protein